MKIMRKTSSTLCVDIHGMREREAKFRLESLIENGSADITRPGDNSGQTIIILKQGEK